MRGADPEGDKTVYKGRQLGVEHRGSRGAQDRDARMKPMRPLDPNDEVRAKNRFRKVGDQKLISDGVQRSDRGLPAEETQRVLPIVEPIRPIGGRISIPSEERRGSFNPDDWKSSGKKGKKK